MINQQLLDLAKKHVSDILTIALEYTPNKAAVVVFDERSELSTLLGKAYRECLPNAKHVNFDQSTPEEILAFFEPLVAGDLVALIQSTSFRLNEFRIRVELFKRGLKVIEHPHLARMTGEEASIYIESLAYDPLYYRGVGSRLKERIDQASHAIVDSDGEELIYNSPFESTKLNTGDYSETKNVGGQFPIGEVFTEPKDLEAVNGKVRIFVFGDTDFCVNKPEHPITLVIQRGRVIDVINSTAEFDKVIEKIKEREGEVWIRELGFGMNRSFSADRFVSDIGTYERMCGIHLSLGTKHTIYKKPNFKQRDAGFHVDVFPITKTVKLDDEIIYKDGAWIV